uniref:NADP-dependent oxidoreductase domain-containing protein n=1 Tax=Dunaliella tertiolecta TaxID=3047 RepID=A0A7S3VHC0_DUNTE|mmetsp:Transcript_4567/g.12484  ORF Transcript_4567/g.12484 Transcript_4567/m.12484 type:complete len:326 (+) Transcript_4567:66-1043(+)|eukprot:CAMPEP_0202368220 /NCGR_PEP_ID=MMETSP1127-20130417/382_1 /ASSEMBLY_ACC=CAM_ASM_000462 /TAXON_ID=3047 /ORGANISM="Dunaliella tertiolecta, Strain CCMP1320" /LENGTH=325 /DNA_ID=CAMNT_0048963607 /DNA_START=58 /DNA_END=1035 /DNA_ORIENTATION=+
MSSLKLMPTSRIALSSGRLIPAIGFGTGTQWFMRADDRNSLQRPLNPSTVEGIRKALKNGWDHIDAAEMYGTEPESGLVLSEHLDAQADRKEARERLYVTSKVFHSLKHGISVQDAARDALARLRLEYLDLWLIHAPFLPESVDMKQIWRDMEKLVDDGTVRDIGVSNFRVSDLDTLLASARIKPVINQVEANPYLQQPELKAFCDKNGILVEAYSPLAPITSAPGGPLDPLLEELAKKHQATPAQILLRWSLQSGYLPITTTKSEQRMHEFRAAAALPAQEFATGPSAPGSLALTKEEVDRISTVGSQLHVRKFWQKEFEQPSS